MGAAACETVNIWPPTSTEPARAMPVLDAARIVTVPGPVPVAPAVTDIQGAPLDVAHEHPLGLVTATVAVPPASETSTLDAASVMVQAAAS
jgi:hypothetical protein